jgi:hypothetical protein
MLIVKTVRERAEGVDVDLEIVIEGVTDLRVQKEIKRQVRKASESAPRSGEWSLFVAPSETRGEWDSWQSSCARY